MANQEKAKKERLEFMREQVLEVELQARYWKAMHDTKLYTIADDKLKPEYDEFIEKAQKAAMEDFEKVQKEQAEEKEKALAQATLSTSN